jgi:hypothetical protein
MNSELNLPFAHGALPKFILQIIALKLPVATARNWPSGNMKTNNLLIVNVCFDSISGG